MNKKATTYFAQSILLLCAVVLFSASSIRAGYFYVLNEKFSAPGNTIEGYSVNETTGVLTLLPGFPVATGGQGGARTNADEQLTIDRANKRLYVVNDVSNTVSAYSIDVTTGALTQMPFSPIALTPVTDGTYDTIAVHPSGSPLIVGNNFTYGNGSAVSYNITATTATPASGSPFSLGVRPRSSIFSRDGDYFYIGGAADASGGTSNTRFAGFSVNAATGVLTALVGSPFESGGQNPVGYSTDAQGRLFMANFANDEWGSRAFMTTSGIPSAASGNPFPAGIIAVSDSALHPNGNFIAFADSNFGRVASYQISGSRAATTLTRVAGTPVSTADSGTNGLVFNQSGTFLFAGNAGTISVFSFNGGTGAMSRISNQTLVGTGSSSGIDYLPVGVVPPTTSADLSVTKTASPANSVPTGGQITYTVTVSNSGPDAASNVVLSDVIPTNTTYVSGSSSGFDNCSNSGTATGITCTAASLASGASATLTFIVQVNQGTTAGTIITNTASVLSSTPDPDGSNNSATAETTVANEADLALSIVVSPDPVASGGTSTYRITLANNGGLAAQNIVLTQSDFFRQRGGARLSVESISAPAGWTCQTANPLFNPSTAEVVCRGSLNGGQTAQFTIVKKQRTPIARGVVIYHEAQVSSDAAETNTQNNRATDTTRVQ